MPRTVTNAIAGVTVGACMCASGATGAWSGGKPIDSDEGPLIRYTLDLGGDARLHVILPTESKDGMSAPRAVHLVPHSELRAGTRHWLHYTQETCRWDVRATAWTDLVIGDRMGVFLSDTSWADDASDDAAAPGAPAALDSQLLETASAPEPIALFDVNREMRTTVLPAPQMLDAATGFCMPPMASGDNGVVGNVVLVAQMDDGHRVLDLSDAAETLYESIARRALVGMRASAAMVGVDGLTFGEVNFEQTPHGVLIGVSLSGISPGPHGIHLHRLGSCTPDFKAASGHINPHGAAYGLRDPDGPDNGDLPLLHVSADGSAVAEFYTTLVSPAADALARTPGLFDAGGSAVIIHANPDDHLTQPIRRRRGPHRLRRHRGHPSRAARGSSASGDV